MNLKKFLKPSSENLTASGTSAFRSPKRMSNFYYWVKPDWRKIVIFVIFFALSYVRKSAGAIPALGYLFIYHGFPFYYFSIWLHFNVVWKVKILWVGLLIDLIFWYLFSCFIIWIYDKVKKKEVKKINS